VYLNQKNQKKVKVVQKTNLEVSRTDYSTVARKTLDWIDNQRNDQGWYILERGCDFTKKTCDTVWDNQEGNKDGLIATWARFNFYQQTKDPKDLEIVKSDINRFYEKYPNGVDNTLWICKITYDMWKSDLFDQTTKDKLEKICFESKIATSKNLFDEVTSRNNIRNKVAENKNVWESWDGYSLLLRGFNAYITTSTDLVYKYLWKNDLSYLDSAKKNFYEAKAIIDKEPTFSTGDKCLLAMSALDIYEAGKEEKYFFDQAKNLYDTLVLNSDAPRKATTPTCGLLTKRLLKITADEKYLKSLEFFGNVLVKFNYDGGVNVLVSDNSFYKSDKGLVYAWYKDVVENGLMVELLRN